MNAVLRKFIGIKAHVKKIKTTLINIKAEKSREKKNHPE